MKLNRKALPVVGMLLLATAFMHAASSAPSNSIEFDVLAEGSTTTTPGFALETPATGTDTATATPTGTWQRHGRIAIATMGYQDCPVLPGSMTISEGVASIDLTVVERDLTCSPTRESYTTVVRLKDWDEYQGLRLEIREATEHV